MTRPREVGTRRAAPAACSTRRATKTPTLPAAAHRPEATVKIATPSRKPPLRLVRSATRPAGTRRAGNTIAYAFRTQDRLARAAPGGSRAICGRATLTMNRSRLDSTTPAQTIVSTRPGAELDRGAVSSFMQPRVVEWVV